MSGWLPPGVTDKDIDDAAPGADPARAAGCDNCGKLFDPEEEGCFIGWHPSYGDCCQCAQCVDGAKGFWPNCDICGKSMRECEIERHNGQPVHGSCKEDYIHNQERDYEPE